MSAMPRQGGATNPQVGPGSGEDAAGAPRGSGRAGDAQGGGVWLTAVLWAGLLAMTVRAIGFDGTARIAPLTFGVVATVLASVLLASQIRTRTRSGQEKSLGGAPTHAADVTTPPHDAWEGAGGAGASEGGGPAQSSGGAIRKLTPFLWLAVAVVGLLVFGFVVGMSLFMITFLWIHGRERWYVALGLTACVMAFIYVLFTHFLGVQVYPGLLGGAYPDFLRW